MSLFTWGENRNSELGLSLDDQSVRIVPEPSLVQNLEGANLVQIAGGNGHTLVLNRNGEVFAFGRGHEGQLGLGSEVKKQAVPSQVKDNGLGDCIVRKICAGDGCSAAITTHGELFEWGFIHAPTDGDANNPSNALPGMARETRGMSEHLKELLRASTIQYLQGGSANNNNGDHGMDQEQIDAEAGILVVRTRRKMKYSPVKSAFRHKVRDIALGYGHTLIVTEVHGTAWAKGYNDRGQLGVGTRINEVEFVPVLGALKDVAISAIACGNSHNLAVIAATGEMWAWGSNVLGQLGIGEGLNDQLLPTRTLIDKPVMEVSSGSYHSVALTVDHTLYSFGHSEYGQHGQDVGTVGDYSRQESRHFFVPRVVGDFRTDKIRLVSVRCGQQFTCGLDEQGALWTWGFGASGNLGHGLKQNGNFAQRVEALEGHIIIEISAGHKHSLALTAPVGHPFALKNQPSQMTVFDCELSCTAKDPSVIECHRAIILARCPALRQYFVDGKKCVLPLYVENRVLTALLEYLYTDVVRSCPPHRLKVLQDLAASSVLNLPRLAYLCSLQRYQRNLRFGFEFAEGELRVTKYSQVPPSIFATDMLYLLRSESFHDLLLAAADYPKLESLPPGHTAFSWNSQQTPSLSPTFPGHTPFSIGKQLTSFKAHSFLLMRYPFFEALLNGHFKEEETVRSGGLLRLDTVPDAQSMQAMLEWIYSGTVEGGLSGDNVADLLRTSKAFGVDDLAQSCELLLLEALDRENAENVLILAKENGLTKLARECEFVIMGGDDDMDLE